MERRDPHRPAVDVQQALDALAHLGGRLVGEGDGDDLVRTRQSLGDQIGDAMGDHPGLARAGAGKDQQRAFGVTNRVLLLCVEGGEEIQPSYSTVTLLARFLG